MGALSLLILFSGSLASAASGEMFAELFAPPGAAQRGRAALEFRQYGESEVKLNQTKFDASLPLARNESGSWRTHAQVDYDAIETSGDSTRFSNGRLMPNRLWDIGAGFSHARNLEDGKVAGGSLTIHSPSDRPFGRARDYGFNLNLSLKLPQENESAWILFLSASNTRGFLNYFPLPGAAYAFKANDRLRLVLGLPFVLALWTPADAVTVLFSYFPLRNAEARIGLGKRRGLSGYLLARFRTRNFRLHDRPSSEERLFQEDGLAQAGIQFPLLGPALSLETGAAYAFERRYYLAEKQTQRSSAPTLKPAPVAIGFAKLNAIF